MSVIPHLISVAVTHNRNHLVPVLMSRGHGRPLSAEHYAHTLARNIFVPLAPGAACRAQRSLSIWRKYECETVTAMSAQGPPAAREGVGRGGAVGYLEVEFDLERFFHRHYWGVAKRPATLVPIRREHECTCGAARSDMTRW